MRVVIYARYSSENQSEKSIDDQVRVCKKYITENGLTLAKNHIYADEAVSGSLRNRPGLQALENAMENKEFDAVAVDDLSRLSRSNHQMLTMVMKFNYHQVKIISVSDGIITDDDNAKLGIHIRGFINELYLDDLKKKTMRGLEGQKLRGFSTGESVFGYNSHPVGELKLNKKGQPKYEGMAHKIDPQEADFVRRIFDEFIQGKSISKIVKNLNNDRVPTKKGFTGGWNTSTVSRILKNEKYIGKWVWRKWKNVRDPLTGKIKKVFRPEKDQLSQFKEDLVIIDKEIWEKGQKRWQEIDGAFPVRKGVKGKKQKSYVHTSPTHLLAGLLKCDSCGGAIVLISGKGSRYYGCYNAKRKTCENKLIVPRKRVEEIIIKDLKEKILTSDNLLYVYKNLENLIQKELNQTPEHVKKKRHEYEKIAKEIQNYLNFIKSGNFSNAVAEAMKEAESKGEILQTELKSLEYQEKNTFKSPPREWIDHMLEEFRGTLSKNTTASALALKGVLGEVWMEAVVDDLRPEDIIDPGYSPSDDSGMTKGKPYYVAHTKIQTLALLDEKYKGSNWYQWRRR